MNEGIKDTGLIMLITGVGGSLGYVVRASGIGSVLGKMVVGLPIPAVLIPFCIAALMRIVLCHFLRLFYGFRILGMERDVWCF